MSTKIAVILEGTVEDGCAPHEIQELTDNSIEIGNALEALGYRTEVVSFTLDIARAKKEVEALEPAVAFNLVDSIEGMGSLVTMAPMLMEHMGIPCTGADAISTATSCHKLTTKQILRGGNVPTPDWMLESEIIGGTKELKTPYILKSITEHASFGMFHDNVVHTRKEMQQRLQEKKAKYWGDWFAEAYIDGREFNVGVLATSQGPQALLPAELTFTEDFPKDRPRIIDYAAKWHTETPEYIGTVRRYDFPQSDKMMLKNLERIAQQCWEMLGVAGYARVDYRVDEEGNPYVLEVNSNPFLTAKEGFGLAAQRSGFSFVEAVGHIVEDALRRRASIEKVRAA